MSKKARKNESNAAASEVSAEVVAVAIENEASKPEIVIPTLATAKIADDMKPFNISANECDQKRTRLTQAKPWHFYLQPKVGGRKSGHQLPNVFRPESCSVFMPSRALYEQTGNPYPNTLKHEAAIVSAPAYDYMLPSVVLGHCLFNYILTADSEFSAADLYFDSPIIDETAKLIGKPLAKRQVFDKNWLAYAVLDILKDLENCNGFVIPANTRRNRDTKWQLQPELKQA